MYSEDPFAFFGLDRQTATLAEVKREYAKRLKTTRPDDDPAGFMLLRETMERAREQIEWREDDRNDPYGPEAKDRDEAEPFEDEIVSPHPASEPGFAQSFGPASEPELDDLPPEPKSSAPAFQPIGPDEDRNAVSEAIRDVEALMKNEQDRKVWARWLDILERPAFDSIDAFNLLSIEMRNKVCAETGFNFNSAHHAKMSPRMLSEILLKLDDRFGWSHQSTGDWGDKLQNRWVSRLVELSIEYRDIGKSPWGRQKRGVIKPPPVKTKRPKYDTPAAYAIGVVWAIVRAVMLYFIIRLIIDSLG